MIGKPKLDQKKISAWLARKYGDREVLLKLQKTGYKEFSFAPGFYLYPIKLEIHCNSQKVILLPFAGKIDKTDPIYPGHGICDTAKQCIVKYNKTIVNDKRCLFISFEKITYETHPNWCWRAWDP